MKIKLKPINYYFVFITLIIVFLDQLIKRYVKITRPNFNFFFFNITYLQNTGAGFGILKGQVFILAIISLIVTLLILYIYPKFSENKTPQTLLALFLAGTVGNMIDRFFNDYVIDYLATTFWPAFNLADTAITISVIGFVIYFCKNDLDFFEKK